MLQQQSPSPGRRPRELGRPVPTRQTRTHPLKPLKTVLRPQSKRRNKRYSRKPTSRCSGEQECGTPEPQAGSGTGAHLGGHSQEHGLCPRAPQQAHRVSPGHGGLGPAPAPLPSGVAGRDPGDSDCSRPKPLVEDRFHAGRGKLCIPAGPCLPAPRLWDPAQGQGSRQQRAVPSKTDSAQSECGCQADTQRRA